MICNETTFTRLRQWSVGWTVGWTVDSRQAHGSKRFLKHPQQRGHYAIASYRSSSSPACVCVCVSRGQTMTRLFTQNFCSQMPHSPPPPPPSAMNIRGQRNLPSAPVYVCVWLDSRSLPRVQGGKVRSPTTAAGQNRNF